jgi:predicted component of type VI protein secretion system
MAAIRIIVRRHNGREIDGPAAQFDELGGAIGRGDFCTLVLEDLERCISRVHARVRWQTDRFVIEVRGAQGLKLNGGWLNLGEEALLAEGDELGIGLYELAVTRVDAVRKSDDWDPFGEALLGGAPAPAGRVTLEGLFDLRPEPVPAMPAAAPVRADGRAPAPLIPDDWDPLSPLESNGSDPVWFAVTAPSRMPASRTFVAALMVHVESLRAVAERQLQHIGGPQAESLMDLAPHRQSGWRTGAPVTVRLRAEGGHVEPEAHAFEWNGRLHLAAFQVHPDAADASPLQLTFHVLLAGVPMACIPLHVEREVGDSPVAQHVRPAPSSAFASYASADAPSVGLCLSALTRWAPGLAIFQDCLDLRPGEAFKPQLERRIAESEAFLLFWSRRAAASPWVRWELDVARRGKAPDALVPMPLEDPALAPPPPDLADRHWRDRFMMARQAWAHLTEEQERTQGTSETADLAELMAALREGLGVSAATVGPLTPALMRRIGQLLHESTRGMLYLVDLQKQAGAQPLTILPQGNNPLHVGASLEAALDLLLGPQRPGFMAPDRALRDTYESLRSGFAPRGGPVLGKSDGDEKPV